MVQVIESMVSARTLGELFHQLRTSEQSTALPVDDYMLRMCRRMGFCSSDAPEEVEAFIAALAEQGGRTGAQVSMVMRLYSAGLDGLSTLPVCGDEPRCRACGLTKECDYFNEPRRQARRPGLAVLLAEKGAAQLEEYELLALVLGGSRAGEEHKKTAQLLIGKYLSVRELFQASYEEVVGLRDVSKGEALRIAAAAELVRRIAVHEYEHGTPVKSGKDFFQRYHQQLRDFRKEVFLLVMLNQKNHVIRDEQISEGTLTASLVHPREVFAPAIRHSAAAVAFVHNHPSGDPAPSPEDKTITKRLVEAGELLGIRILDHVIIGEGRYTSFVDEGLL